MKIAQRHPICITKFKRKQSISMASSHNENHTLNSQLTPTLPNVNYQNQIIKQTQTETQSNVLHVQSPNTPMQSHQILEKQSEQKFKVEREELLLKISSLESSNSQLVIMNRYLQEKVQKEEKEKILLSKRIQVLENNLLKFEEEFQKEYQKYPKSSPKSTPIDIHLSCFKEKQIDTQIQSKVISSSVIMSRRHSFSQNMQQSQDLYSKVKQYKNQLSIQKLKRFNLEKELSICYDNARLSFKMEIDGLNKKVQLMRECINRKDKEISEKEDLISRHILNK